MGEKVGDLSEYTGDLAADDYLYLLRSGQALGSRDFKFSGSRLQKANANLTALAGLTLIVDRLPYANGTGTLALATFTALGRSICGAAAPADARAAISDADDAVTAFATGGQASATPLTKLVTRIAVCASDADSVALPVGTAGDIRTVNNDTGHAAQVFAATPGTIDGIATGTGISLAAGGKAFFACSATGKWFSILSA